MISDVRSPYFDTSNPYLKYQIIVSEDAVLEESNKSILNITVEAWRTNEYSTDRAGTCWVRLDGDDRLGAQGWESGEKVISYMSDTEVYHVGLDSEVDPDDPTQPYVVHDADGSKTVYIDAAITWWSDGQPYYDSYYQGFYVTLTKINRGPAFEVTLSTLDVKYNSASFRITSAIEGKNWYYRILNPGSAEWSEWTNISSAVAMSVDFNITGLQPNSTYKVQARVMRNAIFHAHMTADSSEYTLRTPTVPISNAVVRRITLYDANTTDFSTNGLGSLLDAFSCVITEELNGAFELTMEYPVTGRLFDQLEFRRIIMANPNQYTGPQPFRIYSISKPLNGRVTVNAAHISYDLSGYTLSPFASYTVEGAISSIGSHIDENCPFLFWTDMTGTGDVVVNTPASVKSVMGGSDNSIIGIFGGEYEYDMFNVKLYSRRGADRGVTIRYGKNLTSFKQDSNNSNVYTGIRPYWYKEYNSDDPDGTGFVELPEKILTVGSYDYVKIMLVDFTGQFVAEDEDGKEVEVKPTVEQLRDAAQEFLDNNDIGVPSVSINVSFVQLSDSLEYSNLALLEQVQLGDDVNIQFPKLNVSTTSRCIKTVFNVLSQRYNSINLGSSQANLATTVASNTKAASESVTKNDLQKAINQSSDEVIRDISYVGIDTTVSPNRLISMDKSKKSDAKDVIKVDIQGVTHSSDGVNGPYTHIISQDGSVHTEAIRYGQINGNIIEPTTVNKGTLHEEVNRNISDVADNKDMAVRSEIKYVNEQEAKETEAAYVDGVYIGKAQLVKVSGGVDIVVFD